MKSNDIDFEYIEELADYIVEKVEDDEDLFVTVVGHFEEIKNVIKEIITISEVDFEKINIQSPDLNDYSEEYVLDCWCDKGVVQIGCEPVKKENRYSRLTGDETYMFDTCSSKLIALCEGSELYFIHIDDEYDCDDECCVECGDKSHCRRVDRNDENDCVEYSTSDSGELHGFSASRTDDKGFYSYSFYTSDTLDKMDIHNMLKEFGF